jgi:hypothetical protein
MMIMTIKLMMVIMLIMMMIVMMTPGRALAGGW